MSTVEILTNVEKIKGIKKDFLAFFEGKSEIPTKDRAYFFFLEKTLNIHPYLYRKSKKSQLIAYSSQADFYTKVVKRLFVEKTIVVADSNAPKIVANELTKKLYICPHCNAAFADNLYLNAESEAYNHVATCPDNRPDSSGAMRKNFRVTENAEEIATFVKAPVKVATRTLYTMLKTKKMFTSQSAAIQEAMEGAELREIKLSAIPDEECDFEESFFAAISILCESEKVDDFVEALTEIGGFEKAINHWNEESEE